jgi:hypothetical protein
LAYWGKSLKYQKRPGELIRLGDGVNAYDLSPFDISRSEAIDSRNTSSRKYPALTATEGRTEAFIAITTPNAAGVRNNEYTHVQDGTVWKRWDGSAWQNVQTGLTSGKGKFVDFVGETARYTLLFNGTEKKAWDGTTVTDLTDAPTTNLVCVDDFRVYAVKDSALKCSAEGSITDWTTVLDADSFMLAGMNGQESAIATYNDAVIVWTEQSMHVVYGNDPYDFYPSDPMDDGCISARSVIVAGGKLYFLDFGQFKVYTGGKPVDISQKVKGYLDGINLTYKTLCVSGSQGRYVYLSIPYDTATTNDITLEYDTELQKWHVKDEGYVDFVTIGEHLYGVTNDGEFYDMNTGTFAGSWYHTTGVIKHGTIMQKKTLSDVWLSIDLPIGSTLTLSYSTTIDGDDFVLLETFTASATEQDTRVQISTSVLQNVNHYRLKFAGTGPCTIYFMEEVIRVKAR